MSDYDHRLLQVTLHQGGWLGQAVTAILEVGWEPVRETPAGDGVWILVFRRQKNQTAVRTASAEES